MFCFNADMWVRFTLIGCCMFTLVPVTFTSQGTTLNIKDIFIGRCWEYFEIRPSLPIIPRYSDGETSYLAMWIQDQTAHFVLSGLDLQCPQGPEVTHSSPGVKYYFVTNCTELWSIFSEAWIHKDPSTIEETDYNSFLDAVKQPDIEKILFWSGTFDIAHEYSRHVSYYVTLEDSFLGYLVNGLRWCGMECSNCTGINYAACPDSLHNNATGVFWSGASRTFASSLKETGFVQLLLNGSNPLKPAFNPDSFFSKSELPNLPKSASILVILVHDIGKPVIERCNNGSLLELKNRLETFGFQFDCVENPAAVVHLLCADIPLNKDCSLFFINVATTPAPSPVISCFLCIISFIYIVNR